MHPITHTNTPLKSGTPVSSKLAHMLIQLKETENSSMISPLVNQDQNAKSKMQSTEVYNVRRIYLSFFYSYDTFMLTLVSTKSTQTGIHNR